MSGDIPLRPGWAFAALEDICEAGRPIAYGVLQPGVDDPSGIPLVRVCDINDGVVATETLKKISPAVSNRFPRTVLRGGEVLLTVVGTIGRTAVASSFLRGANTARAVAMIPVARAIDPRYVELILRNSRMRTSLTRAAHEVARKTLNLEDVRSVQIPIAPYGEQCRIVAKVEELFSDLDAGVAALKRAKANLKRYRASVLKAAVEGKLTEEWRASHPAKEPASALLARILKERRQKWEADQLTKFNAAGKEPPKNWREKYAEPVPPDSSELPPLPVGWCWATVQQIAESTRYGSSAKTNEDDVGVPVIRMGNIVDGTVDPSELKFLPRSHPEFPDLLLQKGDLLFNRTNSADLVGKSAVYDGQLEPCSFASYLISVRCMPACDSKFLCHYINSSYGRRWVRSVASQQVGQANVNGSKLQALVFPLPSSAEQRQIVMEVAEKLSQLEAAARAIDTDLLRAARLRQGILKQAFEGKLVPQDPSDEPAGVLLERLRAGLKEGVVHRNEATSRRPRSKRASREGAET